MTARGIRLNNPGNIERGADKWQGMAADQSGDPRFVVFVSPAYGIRALARVLLSYQHRDGCDTLAKIIRRWAPPQENDTLAYIRDVATACGALPDAQVDLDMVAVMLPLVSAIIHHENGEQPYSAEQLLEGLHLAGISDAPEPAPKVEIQAPPPIDTKPTMKSKTIWGGLLAGAATLTLSAGPFILRHFGMDSASADQTSMAVAAILTVLSGNLTVIGRANANIKPLG